MKLNLPANKNLCTPINELIKKLSNRFEITKSSSLEKVVELSTYLLAIEKEVEAKSLLNSFVYEIKDDARSYAWGHRVDGLSLLALIYYLNSDNKNFKKVVDELTSADFDKDDFDWLIEQAEDDLDYYISDRGVFEEIKEQLTEKEVTLGYYSKIVKFSYYYVVLFYFTKTEHKALLDKIFVFLNQEISSLQKVLLKKGTKKTVV